ncbi:hypothetical protein CTAYLR_010422 [Chrysophaeum taylorii]|uniref:peptidylprolyl isomerase n=1 Tax=Chrysophaeum taylorii TaxID=2483200 RepID=A0AAD7UFM0_9STRA|nr:hypothetical protein CTAYLR_010422 [Chrysophaeum taylorii]
MAEDDDDDDDLSARKIQGLWRRAAAASKVMRVARRTWEIGFDAESGEYFYYNKATQASTWEKPLVLRSLPPYRTDKAAVRAAIVVQGMFRSRFARLVARLAAKEIYRKEYDPETGDFYYVNTRTRDTKWEDPGVEVALGGDSKLMLERDRQIEALKQQLEAKDAEIARAKIERFNELGREVRLRRMAEALKGAKRSKNLDEWRNEQVVAWFMDMELDEHVPSLVEERVDGLLLLNMDEDDFAELGITKRIHQRKIEVALRKYRRRYEIQQAGGDPDDDQKSELDDADDDDDDDESDEDFRREEEEGEGGNPPIERDYREVADENDLLPTEDELLELEKDRANVQIQVAYPGDEATFPEIGDVVRCHCVCRVKDSGTEIENTRRKKLPLEFVLGVGQVVLGVDRGLVQMSFGERSTLTVSAEYAYGAAGLEPLVPPNSTLIFDLELLRMKRRPPWIKPLIQPRDLTEFPYEEEERGTVPLGDDDRSATATVASTNNTSVLTGDVYITEEGGGAAFTDSTSTFF